MALSGSGDDVVHEVEELDAPTARLVSRRHLAGGHLESGEQGRGAVALVVVTMAGQRPGRSAASDSPVPAPAPGSRASSTQMTIAFSGGAM